METRRSVREESSRRAKAEDDSICRSRCERFWGPVARFTAWHANHARKLARDRPAALALVVVTPLDGCLLAIRGEQERREKGIERKTEEKRKGNRGR